MPQRTLRGKRHIRARASVQIGRDRKRIKKFNRGIASLNRAIGIFCSGEWMRQWAAGIAEIASVMSKAIITNLTVAGNIAEAQKEILERYKNADTN